MQQEWLSLSEAAERLGVSIHTARRWARDGKLRAEQHKGAHGTEYRVRADELPTEPSAPLPSADWRCLLGMFALSSLLEVSAWGHIQAFSPLFLGSGLGVPDEDVPRWTGILTAAPLLLAAPLSPFWGVLADRYSRKVVILRCF